MSDPVGGLGPERLSPVPVTAQPCPLPYALTWDDVRDALPGFTDPTGARAWVSHTKRGLHKGERSCILTLTYRGAGDAVDAGGAGGAVDAGGAGGAVDAGGAGGAVDAGGAGDAVRERTLFFKRVDDPARAAEAEKYRFLASQSVPTPRMYAAVSREGREVLVCEFLPTIGIEPGEADALLGLVAQLNAVPQPPAELFRPVPGVPAAEFEARVRDALDRLAADPATSVPVEPRRWFRIYQRAQEAVAAMPLALNHNELAFQQVGWSGAEGARRLVLFDLETMFVLPRFADLADVLDALVRLTGRDECDLVAAYVRAWMDRTGDVLDEGDVHAEIRLLRVMRSFESLPWLTEVAGHPEVTGTPAATARLIHADAKTAGLLD